MPQDTFRFQIGKKTFSYQASPCLQAFHQDRSFVRGIMGPLGSGKTTACCYELMRRILQQPPNYQNRQAESLVVIIRNTYSQLKDTSLRTWLQLFPESSFGKFYAGDMVHKIRFQGLKADVLFRALDKPEDEKKILSLEATWIYVNEARELPFALIQMLPRRLRFPKAGSSEPFRQGIIMDTNPPDVDHWWYHVFEEQKPPGWRIFKQPSGIAENAENLANLPAGYYVERMAGLPSEWLKVYRDGEYGFLRGKTAVYPEYQDNRHSKNFETNPTASLILGLDFGRTPAAVFLQLDAWGNYYVLDELVTDNIGAIEFAEILKAKLVRDFSGLSYKIYGDPAGNQKSQTDSKTVFQALEMGGILAFPAFSNKLLIRREALRTLLRADTDHKPKIWFHKRCVTLRKALSGGFCYHDQKAGGQSSESKVLKNRYSHPVEALEYAILRDGEAMDFLDPHRSQEFQASKGFRLEAAKNWFDA